ncbi:MAG TPA: FAD/NAD(P)-binding oxidoreductase [Terriglobales bacterium]|nr:FAD/NAD(P)-binding oxidoreductase [Terriglobales bacterium]
MTSRRWEVVVVGAGPAGMAAAVSASQASASILLVDDNPESGGQIWRGGAQHAATRQAEGWHKELAASTVEVLQGFRIFDHPAPNILLAESSHSVEQIGYSRLILCTGARELFLPFPGWTLPNVMGAGGLQALVKSGFPIQGKSVVVAGSGPLLLPVAAYLLTHGAKVQLIAEQARRASAVRFGFSLVRQPAKLTQAISLMRQLAGIPYAFDSWPIQANGSDVLKSMILRKGGSVVQIECDFLACGFHLVPNTELAALLGCEICDGTVRVDEWQRTSVRDVYCAGEPTGIGGVDSALLQGQIAGFAATGQVSEGKRLFRTRDLQRRFAANLERTFLIREELKRLPQPETLICRCEDVSFERLQPCRSWREAKLYTRCGMGPCQGRICGAATRFLFGWQFESVRAPVFAARVESLMVPVEQPNRSSQGVS